MTTLTENQDTAPAQADDRELDTRGAWLLVMNREIIVRALTKSFLIGLVVSIVLIAALGAFFAWQDSRTTTHTVAVTGADAAAIVGAADAVATEQDLRDELVPQEVVDDDAARAALAADEADAWLHESADGWVLVGQSEPDTTVTRLLATAVEQRVVADNATAAGTSVDELLDGAVLTTESLDPGAVDPQLVFFAGFAIALLFFLGAIGSGQMVAGSVVEEKQSRLVEIMATAVPLRHLLAGKILGSSVIALAQNVVFVGVGLIAISFTPVSGLLPVLSASLLWFVAFFTVGFVGLAAIFAVTGALASRMEDLQNTTTPMTFVLMGVYFVTFSASGTFATVLSYLPITSVVTMPVRVLGGDAAWWEPVVSLGILGAFAYLAVLVCERAYRGALLQTGGRISWKRALRAEA